MTKNVVYSLGLLLITMVWSGCGDDEDPLNLEPGFTESDYTFTVVESITDTEVIGTLMAEDNENGTLTFSILLNDENLFEVDGSTGELSLSSGASLDYEAATSHTIAVQVTDAAGLSSEIGVNVNVTDDTVDNIMASFDFADSSAYEGAAGTIAVTIALDQVVLIEGASVLVNINPGTAVYGENYTTEPAEASGVIEIPVTIGQSATSFALEIMDDLQPADDYEFSFEIAAGADNIIIPSTANSSGFTAVNDDTADALFYADGTADETPIYTISTITGTANYYFDVTYNGEPVGNLRNLEYDPVTQNLYASNTSGVLYSIDVVTGEADSLTSFALSSFFVDNALTFGAYDNLEVIDGVLYQIVTGRDAAFVTTYYLVSYDISTEAVTVTAATGVPDFATVFGLGAIGNQVYMTRGFSAEYLYEFDLGTATVGDVAALTPSDDAIAAATEFGGNFDGFVTLYSMDANYSLHYASPGDNEFRLVTISDDLTLDFVTGILVSEGFYQSLAYANAADLP